MQPDVARSDQDMFDKMEPLHKNSQKCDTLQTTFHTSVCAIQQDWDAESAKVTTQMANIL
jgi:hypothetical protein